ADDDRAAIEFFSGGFERLLGGLHVGIAELVARGGQRGLGAIIDGEDAAIALHAAGGLHFVDALHGSVQNFRVGDAENFYVEELAKSPAGVVVGSLLRVVGAPVLMIEQGVGDAGIGL